MVNEKQHILIIKKGSKIQMDYFEFERTGKSKEKGFKF